MNKLIFSAILAGFLFGVPFIFSFPVKGFAENAKETAKDRVQIIEDDKSGVVRIVIEGKEVVLIDADGFHVNGNIDYNGTITDTGIPSQPKREGK